MKKLLACLAIAGLTAHAAKAANPITLSVDTAHAGNQIAPDFVGMSFSRMSISGASTYTILFNSATFPQYSQLVNLCQQIGVKHLRTICGKGDPTIPDPSAAQDDSFFNFANAIGANAVYSLHLFNGDDNVAGVNNVASATHIWNTPTDKARLEAFALDNEPDWHGYMCCADPIIKNYYVPTGDGYVNEWSEIYNSLQAANVASGAKFVGPDTGSKWPAGGTSEVNTSINGVPFSLRFSQDQTANIITVTQHYYGEGAGDPDNGGLTSMQMCTDCLSPGWVSGYATLYNQALGGNANFANGTHKPYRFTECAPFSGGTNPGTQVFATALWSLDFANWWASQQYPASGVDPFERIVQYNVPLFQTTSGDLAAQPVAYGWKAFNLAGPGKYVLPITVTNSSGMNLTAYACGNSVNSSDVYVTVINKTFGTAKADASVSISVPGFNTLHASTITLWSGTAQSPTPAKAYLGGATIPNTGAWAGTWTTVTPGAAVTVQAASATIVHLQNY